MKTKFAIGLFAIAALASVSCVSGGGTETSPASTSRPSNMPREEQTAAVPTTMPLSVEGEHVNAEVEPRSGFAVTSLAGQVYLPREAIRSLKERVPRAERSLTRNPGDVAALKTLAYNALAGANADAALGYLRIAEERSGGLDDEGLNIRGVAYFLDGRDALALDDFLNASRRNGRNPLPNLNLGLLKAKRGNSLEALLYFKRAIASEPNNFLGYLHAANAAYTNKQYKSAADLLEKGLAVAPGNALAMYNLGVVQHYGLRQHVRAKENFRAIIQSNAVSDSLKDLARGMLQNVQREET